MPQITVIVTVTQGGRGEGDCYGVGGYTYPAFRTAPVQLKEDAAVPVAFALYGDAMTLSPSSSSDTAVVRLIRSSSEICKMKESIRQTSRQQLGIERYSLSMCIYTIYVCY